MAGFTVSVSPAQLNLAAGETKEVDDHRDAHTVRR